MIIPVKKMEEKGENGRSSKILENTLE